MQCAWTLDFALSWLHDTWINKISISSPWLACLPVQELGSAGAVAKAWPSMQIRLWRQQCQWPVAELTLQVAMP